MNKIEIAGFIITLISSLITAVGFIFTIIQIMKTKQISNAAYTAASEAKTVIKNTIVISDLSQKIKSMQEIQNDIVNEKNDAAFLRTKDLIHALIEIRQLALSMKYDGSNIITQLIAQLSILRRQLEAAVYKKEKLEVLKINQKLSDLEIELSELTTRIKFPLSEGNK
jgi:hypothetical protein